jgi:hypothetical protein
MNGEIEVICQQCGFPTVATYDENGKLTGFHEEPGPATEDEALAQGWLDHGFGLYCPSCSLTHLEEQRQEEAQGVRVGAELDLDSMFERQALQGMGVSEDTAEQFTALLRAQRYNKYRRLSGFEPLPLPTPTPKDEAQAEEFLRVAAVLAEKKP